MHGLQKVLSCASPILEEAYIIYVLLFFWPRLHTDIMYFSIFLNLICYKECTVLDFDTSCMIHTTLYFFNPACVQLLANLKTFFLIKNPGCLCH